MGVIIGTKKWDKLREGVREFTVRRGGLKRSIRS